MVLGLAVNEAVGAGAGGGGGGGAEATFFLPQALTASTTASATIIRIHRLLVSFNSSASTFQREHSHQFMAGPKCVPSAQPDEAWAFRQSACECFCLRYGDPGSLASSFERSLRRKQLPLAQRACCYISGTRFLACRAQAV